MLYKYIIILILCLFIGCDKNDQLARKNIGHFVNNKITEETGFILGYNPASNNYIIKLKDGSIHYWYYIETEDLAEQE